MLKTRGGESSPHRPPQAYPTRGLPFSAHKPHQLLKINLSVASCAGEGVQPMRPQALPGTWSSAHKGPRDLNSGGCGGLPQHPGPSPTTRGS